MIPGSQALPQSLVLTLCKFERLSLETLFPELRQIEATTNDTIPLVKLK
jgi:hypothetical protein